MKHTWIYIILVVSLILVAVYLYLKDEKNTLDPDVSDFSLEKEEVSALDSMVLIRNHKRLKLHRSNNRWYVNAQMYAREKAVSQFLNVLEDLQVESPAQKSNRQELLELIRSNPIYVSLYCGNDLIKNYLVEDSEYKKGVTYMMMKGSNEPFVMSLPGFRGNLATLYKLDPQYWRDKTLFDYSALDIKSIKVRYPSNMEHSFYLNYEGDVFRLQSLSENKFIEDFNGSRAARYFSYFTNVRFDRIIQDDKKLLDSLEEAIPYCIFEIMDNRQHMVRLETYRKKSEVEHDAFGQKSYYDLNYLYGRFKGAEEILLIKYTEFDPLLKEINYFREK